MVAPFAKGDVFTPAADIMRCRCGGEFQAGSTVDAETGATVGAIVHTEKVCPEFARLDPVDFLRWVRRATDN